MTKHTRFSYLAVNKEGKTEKGFIEAETDKAARQLLRSRGLFPTAISPAKQALSLSLPQYFKRSSLPTEELTLLTRQLATLFNAGLPIAEVLSAVAEQNAHGKSKNLLLSVKTKVLEGHSLATALSEQGGAFSELFCSLIAAGEKSGKLATILERLAAYTEEQARLKQKVTYALIYPISLIFVSLSIVIFLLDYVVPKMVAVYSHLHQTLPWLTRFLIALSQGLMDYGLYLLLAFALASVGFYKALKTKVSLRERFDRFLLRLPVLGKALLSINTARYSKTLSMLSSSGLPLLDSMKTASLLISNLPIRYGVEEAAKLVREGAAIHLALKQSGYFPPMSIHLIASGEASGELEKMLEHSAKQQEEEIFRMVETLLKLFEPALILVMGGIVLFIVLAVLLPIFDLNQLSL